MFSDRVSHRKFVSLLFDLSMSIWSTSYGILSLGVHFCRLDVPGDSITFFVCFLNRFKSFGDVELLVMHFLYINLVHSIQHCQGFDG